jgi:hypothetical protein
MDKLVFMKYEYLRTCVQLSLSNSGLDQNQNWDRNSDLHVDLRPVGEDFCCLEKYLKS